jgi:hypothetical protein
MSIKDQYKIMVDMREAMSEALFKVAEKHAATGVERIEDACFLGAAGWLFCQLLDAGGHEVDDRVIASLRETLNLVRLKLDEAPTESVH